MSSSPFVFWNAIAETFAWSRRHKALRASVRKTIEAEGGLLAALASGRIAAEAAASLAARRAALADKSDKMIGVTMFTNSDPTPTPVEAVDPASFAVEAPSARLPGPDSRCAPLTPARLAEPFEAGA